MGRFVIAGFKRKAGDLNKNHLNSMVPFISHRSIIIESELFDNLLCVLLADAAESLQLNLVWAILSVPVITFLPTM